MTDKPEYQFKFQIVDKTTGEVVDADWTFLTNTDQVGEGGSIDMHVGQMLRNWNRFVRAEYERKEYPVTEPAEAV